MSIRTLSWALSATAATDRAAAGFATGLADPQFVSADREALLDEAVRAQARFVRINLAWAVIATRAPADARRPRGSGLQLPGLGRGDRRRRGQGSRTAAHGHRAPPGSPRARAGRRPPRRELEARRRRYGQFARAVATRYSGCFDGLPQVRYYQAWNEPNLSIYLTPQYKGKRSVAPEIYRRLLNSFYAGRQGRRSRQRRDHRRHGALRRPARRRPDPPADLSAQCPLPRGHAHLREAKCPSKAKFDVLAHHPINTTGQPTQRRSTATTPRSPTSARCARSCDARSAATRSASRGHHPLWATEIWWSSKPPDPRGLRPRKQALYIEQALYLLWRQGAKVVINLQARDPAYQRGAAAGLRRALLQRRPAEAGAAGLPVPVRHRPDLQARAPRLGQGPGGWPSGDRAQARRPLAGGEAAPGRRAARSSRPRLRLRGQPALAGGRRRRAQPHLAPAVSGRYCQHLRARA